MEFVGIVGKMHRRKKKTETSVERTPGQKVEAQRTKDERIRIRVQGHGHSCHLKGP